MIRGTLISDQDLITAVYPGTARQSTGRIYSAVYHCGKSVTLVVPTMALARSYAREYGARFLGSRVAAVELLREAL